MEVAKWLVAVIYICSASVKAQRNGDLRLVRGSFTSSSYSSGRLEIFINGQWGTVCDDSFGYTDANVACRQMGYSGASFSPVTASPISLYGSGSGPIWLDDVGCTGSESCLLSCSNRGIGSHNCDHSEDVAISCSGFRSTSTDCSRIATTTTPTASTTVSTSASSITYVPARLVNGTTLNEGRVELYIHGHWGTVCDYSFDYSDAGVICKQLGYTGVAQTFQGSYFGAGNVSMTVGKLYCYSGLEQHTEMDYSTQTNIADCHGFRGGWSLNSYNSFPSGAYSRIPSDACTPYSQHVAGVRCIETPPSPYPIRLVGNSSNKGHLQMFVNGQWLSVGIESWIWRLWSNLNVQVVCRQLGFPSTGAVPYRERTWYFLDTSFIVLYFVDCRQLRPYITNCANHGFFLHTHGYHFPVYVSCQVPPINYTYPVRLYTNGSYGINEGTVEILNRATGKWGSVCDNNFGYEEATVVCRMLGFEAAIRSYSRAYFGPSPAMIALDDVQCSGNEDELFDCQHLPWGSHNCSHSEDVGVACINATLSEFPVRLVDGRAPNEGRVEIQYSGVWGTVCDNGWDLNDATVVCQQLGYPGASRIPSFREYGAGNGTIWMDDVQCVGNESSLALCPFSGWADHDCTHVQDAGVVCSGVEAPLTPKSPVPMSPVPMSPVPMSPVPMSPVPMSLAPMTRAPMTPANARNVGPMVAGTIIGVVVVLLVTIIGATIIIWSVYFRRKHSPVIVHVDDDVNLVVAKPTEETDT